MATQRMLIWQGPSQLDGQDIIVLATGVPKAPRLKRDGTPYKTRASKTKASANAKTGDMIQIHILVSDVNPTAALKSGADISICGVCPHKSVAAGGSGACYTHGNLRRGFAQTGTYNAHMEHGSAPFDLERFRGMRVRFGAYGDPAAAPFAIWQAIAAVAAGVTGYTHQWRAADIGFANFCMASADSADEGRQARKMGYRNFIVRAPGEAKPRGAVVCPASAEAGKRTVCASCMQCGGNGNGRTNDITIIAHGGSSKRFRPLPLTVA